MKRGELDTLIANLFARKRRADEAERDALIAGLEGWGARAEKAARRELRRSVEVKGLNAPDSATAVLARLGVVDRQGDIVDPGCLLNPPGDRVPVSEWQHSYLRNPEAMAAGFASVWEQDGELRARVTFSDTVEGRASAQRVNDLLPDWSWGLAEIETRPLTAAERAAGALRAVHKVRVIEVSPVDRAASIASGTLESHCASCALAGSGKCSASPGSCATNAGVTPCHPRRRHIDAAIAALTTKHRATLVRQVLAWKSHVPDGDSGLADSASSPTARTRRASRFGAMNGRAETLMRRAG